MRSVPPALPAALSAHRSLARSYLSSRNREVLCKCNISDHEVTHPRSRGDKSGAGLRHPDWNRGRVIREDGGMTAQILDGKATAAAIKSDLTPAWRR